MPEWINEILIALLTGTGALIASQLMELKRSVIDLNVKFAMFLERLEQQVKTSMDHEHRLRALERTQGEKQNGNH